MIKFILAFLFFTQTSFAQISPGTIDVNVLSGSLTLSGTSTVSGTVAVSNSSFGISGSLPAGTNALGSITNTVFGSTQSGVWNVGLTGSTNGLALESGHAASTDISTADINSKITTTANGVKVDGSAATQPVSGSLGRSWTLASSTDSTSAVITSIPAITGTVTANAGTNLNTSALNLETTQSSINAKIPALGQSVMAASTPVAIASNQSAIPTSRTWNSLASTDSTAAWLNDGLGNAINSQSDGNGGKALEVSLTSTVFVFSSANSTTAQLASLATFTGTIETTTNQPSISIDVVSDQNGILTINQYVTSVAGTKITPIPFNITANKGFSRSFPINGNFINVTFQNTGASATTNLNINTAYGIIPSATSLGNTPISIDEVNGTSFSLGQTTKALSLPVTIASDQTTAVGIKVDAESQVLDFTSTNLASAATYISPWFDTNLYGAGANLYFTIDQPTTYIFEISPDQTIVNTMDTSSVLANVKFQETQYIPTRYWRIKLTNNGVAATTSLFLSSSSRKIPALEYTRIGDRAGNDLSLVNNLTTKTTTNAVPVDIKPNIQNTYHAVFVGAVTATTPTDVFTIAGAAGKKIRIKYVYVAGEQTTSSTIRVNLIKRSTLDTGGISTVITPVASESSQAASSAVVRAYTANPTLGTAIGTFSSKLLRINVVGSTQTPVEFDSTNGNIKDMTLASATEQFAINFNSTTITGDLMAIDVIYTEE